MNDNKKFWNRFAFIYEKVQTTGKDAKKFYQELGAEIGKQLHSDMISYGAYHTVIMWSDFPESFVVCKKKI